MLSIAPLCSAGTHISTGEEVGIKLVRRLRMLILRLSRPHTTHPPTHPPIRPRLGSYSTNLADVTDLDQ